MPDMKGWPEPHPCFDDKCIETLAHGHFSDGRIAHYIKAFSRTSNFPDGIQSWKKFDLKGEFVGEEIWK